MGARIPWQLCSTEGLNRRTGIKESIGTLWSLSSYVKNIGVVNFENIMGLDGKGRGIQFYVRWE